MSLILNALKKAEKDRGSPDENAAKPVFNPIAAPSSPSSSGGPKGLSPKKWLVLGGALLIIAAAGYAGLTFFLRPPDVKPREAVSAPPPPPQDDPVLIKKEALALYKQANYQGSIEKWEKLIALTPTDPEIYNNLGVVQKKIGKKDEARESYRTAISLKPDYAESLNNLGVLLMEKLMNDEAKPLFEKAIQINSQYPDPYFHLALILEEAKDYQGALEKYQAFLNFSANLKPEVRSEIEMRMVSLQNY